MNTQKDDKWLDKLISRTINTEKPEFDAEKWKHKFPEHFQTIQSRAAKTPDHSIKWSNLLKSPVVKFAAAAVIVMAIGFFMIRSDKVEKVEINIVTKELKSPAEMLTLRSLMIAYRNGGVEAVETQCDNAIEKLGPKSKKITVQELLTEINGV